MDIGTALFEQTKSGFISKLPKYETLKRVSDLSFNRRPHIDIIAVKRSPEAKKENLEI